MRCWCSGCAPGRRPLDPFPWRLVAYALVAEIVAFWFAWRSGLLLYDFRHTFASIALEDGRAPTWVAEQMGDSVETVLRTYAHAVPKRPEKSATRMQRA